MERMKAISEKGRVLIRGKDVPLEAARQGFLKYYLHPSVTDTVLQPLGGPLLRIFIHDIRSISGRHIHQGGLSLFVLDGVGYTTTDGVRNDWKEGDLIILPIKRGGVEHQHFNLNPNGPSRWLALVAQMLFELMSWYRIQTAERSGWTGESRIGNSVLDAEVARVRETEVKGTARSDREDETLWGWLFKRRDEQREEVRSAINVVSFDQTPWEWNRLGKLKWYMHPAKKPSGSHDMLIYAQEIPSGSRSGKVQQQGGRAFFVWKGRGYSVINGVRYDWEQDDLLALPISVEGCTYQHFNLDPDNPARLIGVAPNLIETLGVDQGLGFEQLENCPEWG